MQEGALPRVDGGERVVEIPSHFVPVPGCGHKDGKTCKGRSGREMDGESMGKAQKQ